MTAAEVRADRMASIWGPCTLADAFLNKLMIAESGGRLYARNPRSSALGPYQFLSSTFLHVTRRYLSEEISDLAVHAILQLRTDLEIARKAADAYSRENAAYLQQKGLKASATNLHLAFFAGPGGAVRVLTADPKMPVSRLLSPSALNANPFMRSMTAAELIAKSARHVGTVGLLSLYPKRKKRSGPRIPPEIKLRCNLGRASCRKWLFLAKKRLARKMARLAARAASAEAGN